MPGSGKSFVADELVKQGFEYMRFGQIVLDKVMEAGLRQKLVIMQRLNR